MPIRAQFPQPNSDSALLANRSSILNYCQAQIVGLRNTYAFAAFPRAATDAIIRLCCWMHFQRRGLFSVFWLYGLAIFIDESYTRVNVPVKPPFCECCALAIFTCRLLTLVNAATLLNFQFGSRRVETPGCSVFGLLPSVWLRRGHRLRLYELNTQHLRLAHRQERDK